MHKELVYLKGFAKGKEYWQMLTAIQAAIELHEGQKRRAGGDYIEHPMKVVSELVALHLYDENLLAAAILHDVIEDCGVSMADLLIDYHFNANVCSIVDTLSYKTNQFLSIYYQNIQTNPLACLIKISDRCHNISTMIGAFSPDKIKSYIKETEDYVLPLCKYAINHYPEYSDVIYVMRNHIKSVIACIKGFIPDEPSF